MRGRKRVGTAIAVLVFLSAWSAPVETGQAAEAFVLRIVGHNVFDRPTADGKTGKVLRLYVQLRKSEDDPLPPLYRPYISGFSVSAHYGTAVTREIGTFGGAKGMGQGVSILLMVDVSGSMVQFWDLIAEACQKAIESMGENDQLGIGFFGGGWLFSGFKTAKKADELKEWLKKQLDPSIFPVCKERRKLGKQAFMDKYGYDIDWWQRHLPAATDIRTTKLFRVLYNEAIDRAAEGTREVRSLVILSDMIDESEWVDMEGGEHIKGECKPPECATLEQLRAKAVGRRVPLFAIGFRDISPEDRRSILNRINLDNFRKLTADTRGEFQETSDLSEMKVLFSGVRDGLQRLVVADVAFCDLPPPTGANDVTIKYLDKTQNIAAESRSYSIGLSELQNAPDCPKTCQPPCQPGTEQCKDGKCVKLILPPCCEENSQCAEPKVCLPPGEGKEEFPVACLQVTGRSCSERKEPPKEPCQCKDCEICDEKTNECGYKPCKHDEDDRCSPTCRCVEGTGDIPDHCEPDSLLSQVTAAPAKPELDPQTDGECRTDDDCLRKREDGTAPCNGQIPCICVLEKPDPMQCLLLPEKREGKKVCARGPETCGEHEFQFADRLHCGCIGCQTDAECTEKTGSARYECAAAKGQDKICVRKVNLVKEVLKYVIPAIIGVLVIIFLFRILKPSDPLKRGLEQAQRKPRVGPQSPGRRSEDD